MKKLKFKIFRRYKRIEDFLKGHPFWPSFLSNGGMLLFFLILSIGFTILCGINSLKDVLPELRVTNLTLKGDEYTWLRSIYINHDIEKSSKDSLSIKYSFTQDLKPLDYQYDETSFYEWMSTRDTLIYDKDSVMISEFEFQTLVPHELYRSAYDIDNPNIIHYPEYHFGVINSNNGLCFRKYNVCKRGMEESAAFEEVFTGNFLSPKGDNPYIYLHFMLNSEVIFDESNGMIVFNYSHKDPLYQETYSPVNILNVFPEPTYASPSFLIYKDEELKKVIENNGFTFLGEDMGIKKRTDRTTFIWTVLFGTAIATSIEILVSLILKWKEILPKRRRKRS